jgi:hypothetical protein
MAEPSPIDVRNSRIVAIGKLARMTSVSFQEKKKATPREAKAPTISKKRSPRGCETAS